MYPSITTVEVLSHRVVALTFKDGSRGVVDLRTLNPLIVDSDPDPSP